MFLVVDRIEEGIALCEDSDTLKIRKYSVKEMPAGLREGDVVRSKEGVFYIDEAETQKRKRAAEAMLRGVFK